MKRISMVIMIAMLVSILAACGTNSSTNTAGNQASTSGAATNAAAETTPAVPTTVEITDAHGTIVVPINPKNVVALDNRTFETLEAWGIELAAAPKGVMPAESSYVSNDAVQDVGTHAEPNLEIIAAVDPELVIVGQRFAKFYEDIKKLVPNAAVVDFNFNVAAEDGTSGENLVNGFKDATTSLGQIFDKNDEAAQLVAQFDQSLEAAKSAYNTADSVMTIIVSGGNIGYSAPHNGRVWGPLYDIFGWTSSLEVGNTTSDHQGDEISVEAIAQSNPDWLFVLDRDASVSNVSDKIPAQDVIANSPALQNTTAVTNSQILYAPNDTYTNESIQTFIEIFDTIASTLKK